jgi:hypothetical protein
VLAEIDQLRGLCARADREGFIPFGPAFLEGDTGRHLLALDSLLIDAVEVLHGERIAATRGGRWSAGQGYFGRYFWLVGLQSLLHANFGRWGPWRTPRCGCASGQARTRASPTLEPCEPANPATLRRRRRAADLSTSQSDGDREACLASIVTTLKEVHGLLAPRESSAAGENQPLAESPVNPS